MSIKRMPTLVEVLEYALPQLRTFINKLAKDFPDEHKREIEQEGYVRLIENYHTIDPEKGWKSYVYHHARGAVLDYKKAGVGFEESRKSLRKGEEPGSKYPDKIRDRLQLVDADGKESDLDFVLGSNGVFVNVDPGSINIRWELVARMASVDDCLRAFAMHMRGHSIEEIAPTFGHCRARAGQLIQAFVARFDDPSYTNEIWFKQTCYAFDLCESLQMPSIDQSKIVGYSVGWTLQSVDLDVAIQNGVDPQMSMFDE